MNVCITSRSINLFGTYFTNNLENIISNEKTYDEIQRELYQKALKDFNLSETKLDNQETLIQHFTILPEILTQYILKNPAINEKTLVGEINKKRTEIYKASQQPSKEDFQNIITGIVSSLGVGGITVAPMAPLSYNAIARSFAKTISQESEWDADFQYSKNVPDQEKVFEIAVQTSVINSNNSKGYRFKMMTIEQANLNSDISYKYPKDDLSRPVMVLVDKDGNIVKFDEQGNPDVNGKIPAFPIRVSKAEYKVTIESKIDSLVNRKEEPLSPEDASKLVNAEIDNHIAMLNTSRKLLAEKNVFFHLNMNASSIGFVARDHNTQTPIGSIRNISETVLTIASIGKSNFPVLKVPRSSAPARIHNKPLDQLSEKELDYIAELIVNPDLKIDGNPLPLIERTRLITNFIQFRASSNIKHEIPFAIKDDGVRITSVVLGDSRAIVFRNGSPVNFENFKETFIEWTQKLVPFDYHGDLPKDYELVNGLENVTFHNQIFRDGDRIMMARKPEINFGLYRGVTLTDKVGVVSSIKDNEIKIVEKDRAAFISDNGYITQVPNDKGEIRGHGSYLSFSSIEASTEIKEKTDEEAKDLLFRTISEHNKRGKSTKEQDDAADRWWKSEDNPLRKVIRLQIKDKVHEKGPKYVADYIAGLITLYSGSQKTDIYHESWHGLTDSILTKEEVAEIYKEVRGLGGQFTVTVQDTTKPIIMIPSSLTSPVTIQYEFADTDPTTSTGTINFNAPPTAINENGRVIPSWSFKQ